MVIKTLSFLSLLSSWENEMKFLFLFNYSDSSLVNFRLILYFNLLSVTLVLIYWVSMSGLFGSSFIFHLLYAQLTVWICQYRSFCSSFLACEKNLTCHLILTYLDKYHHVELNTKNQAWGRGIFETCVTICLRKKVQTNTSVVWWIKSYIFKQLLSCVI